MVRRALLYSDKELSPSNKPRSYRLNPILCEQCLCYNYEYNRITRGRARRGFCLIRLWWVLAHNNRRTKQNKTTVVVCSASCKPHKQKKDDQLSSFILVGAKGFELRSSRADTISAQGRARAINLFHIGSTPRNTLTHYATHTNDKRA